jgi:hypothetical protein
VVRVEQALDVAQQQVQRRLARELVLGVQQLVQELVQQLQEQSRHHNHERRLQVSKRHRASTGCRRRFSTANCRGQSASCQKRR